MWEGGGLFGFFVLGLFGRVCLVFFFVTSAGASKTSEFIEVYVIAQSVCLMENGQKFCLALPLYVLDYKFN